MGDDLEKTLFLVLLILLLVVAAFLSVLSVPDPHSRRRVWFEVESQSATRFVSIAGGWDSVVEGVLLSGLQHHCGRWVYIYISADSVFPAQP